MFYFILVPIKAICSNSKVIALSILVIGLAVGFYGSAYLAAPPQCDLSGFVDSAMSAMPFFVMGYLLNRFTDILVPNKWDKYLPFIIVVCFAIAFYVDGDCSYKQNVYNVNPIVQYVCGMMGVLGVVFTAKLLRNLPYIAYWGRYSLIILVTHALLLQVYMPVARLFLSNLPQGVIAVIVLAAVMFSYQLIIPLMIRYLPYFTAQKDLIDASKFIRR